MDLAPAVVHRSFAGDYPNGSTWGAARQEASAYGSQCPGQTPSTELEVDLETTHGTNIGSPDDAIPEHASEDTVLASSIGNPLHISLCTFLVPHISVYEPLSRRGRHTERECVCIYALA